jgi:geranylgeranyl pyrophosphate synthase
VTGKEPSDLAKRKQTLPVLYALEHASPEDRRRLLELYGRPEPTADEVAEARSILERSGARDYARAEARRFRDEALAALDATGTVGVDARERLRDLMVSAISA